MSGQDLQEAWQQVWPQALAAWSPYTQLREPVFYTTDKEASGSSMAGQIAAIRLHDQLVMINLQTVRKLGLEDLALQILAHEIGHHVYVPGNLADNARMLAAIKPVLFGLPEDTTHLVANLYGDLLLNDRLQRAAEIDVSAVYRKLREGADAEISQTWQVYTRAYEHLWRLPKGSLMPGKMARGIDGDAALIARLIRHFSSRWLNGARRFASILYPHLHADDKKKRKQTFVCLGLGDLRGAGQGGGIPDGLTGIDPAEIDSGDDFDREIAGMEEDRDGKGSGNEKPQPNAPGSSKGQSRQPFEYGELLLSLGLDLSQHEITTRYYREQALPHLIPYPRKKAPQATEPLPEGYETWEAGEAIEDLDLFGSLLRSPVMVPGLTTVQRVWGESPGGEPARIPLDLDIYIDCSGSMPNPSHNVSYLALAGTILALSALRVGARVQATLWSGPRQFDTTAGFLRDEKRILGVITGYISGGTAFPLHVLRDTYQSRKDSEPPAHIVVVSDDGVDTILKKDEKGQKGSSICTMALSQARGGGTLVLNLPSVDRWKPRQTLEELGFTIHAVSSWEQLIAFARAFVRQTYKD